MGKSIIRNDRGHFSPGALDGGPHVTCRFQEMPMSHVSVTYLFRCPLSNLKNVANVANVEFKKHQCRRRI